LFQITEIWLIIQQWRSSLFVRFILNSCFVIWIPVI